MNPKLAPYRIKMQSLKLGESLIIPWREFERKTVKQRERPISDGKMSWLLTARDAGIEVKRIE